MADETKPAPKPAATTLSTYAQTAAGIVASKSGGSSPCPRPDWSKLPQFDRDIPVLLFLPMCLPGSETASGCPADKAAYVIAVPWNRFAGEGWTSPSGNQYWASTIPTNLKDPKVVALLRIMARRSKDKFLAAYGSGSAKNKTLAAVMADGTWVPKYGDVAVEHYPKMDETAGDFIRRGGYLLWVKGGPFKDGHVLQAYHTPWMGTAIKQAELWGNYVPEENKIGYSIRLILNGSWSRAVNDANGWLQKNAGKLCGKLSGSEMAATAATMSAFPMTQPYAAAYGAALAMCNISFSPPPCTPQPPLPGAAIPTLPNTGVAPIIQTVKGGTIWGTGIQAETMATTTAIGTGFGPGLLPPPIASPYPEGTIAWFEPAARGYHIAIPFPGPGTTHQILSAGVVPSLPAVGIRVVSKTDWEKATLPWLRRSTTKIGMMVAGVSVAAAATAIASTR